MFKNPRLSSPGMSHLNEILFLHVSRISYSEDIANSGNPNNHRGCFRTQEKKRNRHKIIQMRANVALNDHACGVECTTLTLGLILKDMKFVATKN